MGLLTGLVTLPLAPVRGVLWIAETVQEEAERVYYDPLRIRQELEQVEQLRAAGEIDEQDAAAWEDDLVQRLLEARDR